MYDKNEYLAALHEMTLGLLSRRDVGGLLPAIVTRSGQLAGTEHCYVYLITDDGSHMEMHFQSGIYESLVHYPIRPGEGLAGRVWELGTPFRINDYNLWGGRLPDPARDVLRAMAGVPLTVNGDVAGVLGLAYVEEGMVFTDDMMEMLEQFGKLASLALENAHLMEESRRELAERRNAEERLRKLSQVVEQSTVSIIITDTNGLIEYANPYFESLTGYSLQELVGQTPRIFKSGLTSQSEYRNLWETILSGEVWRGEFYNIKKNGDFYWETAVISPVRNLEGAISHFIAIKEDITERKKLESQLRHSQKMEAVGQMAGGIAHDFNNILTAIIGYATIMQMKLPEESTLRNTLEQVIATAERGASLTAGLLAFSRKQISNPVRIDLNRIIRRMEDLLVRVVGEDVRLTTDLCPGTLPVMADSIQIDQVVMNLASNSRDAMPNGGRITISTEMVTLDNQFVARHGFGAKGRFALLIFSDSGSGMDDETVKKIFEPFYTTKETGKGTGLGLSIVYGIIKKHGGYIICNSMPSMGTIFHVYLPILEDAEPLSEVPRGGELVRGENELILLVEDDQATRKLGREVLEKFGYNVIEAEDGLQALELYRMRHNEISLVILDAIMPGLSGEEVFRELIAIKPQERVIFCSGYGADAVRLPEDGAGRASFIAKPYSVRELLATIREVLKNGE